MDRGGIHFFVPTSQIVIENDVNNIFVSVNIEHCPHLMSTPERMREEYITKELGISAGNGLLFCYYEDPHNIIACPYFRRANNVVTECKKDKPE